MPRPIRLSRYLTLRELLRVLGEPGGRLERQRLMRRLRARERALGVTFLVRLGTARNSPLVVTLPALREACPEMFSRRDEAADFMREELSYLHEQMRELRMGQKVLASKIRELRRTGTSQ